MGKKVMLRGFGGTWPWGAEGIAASLDIFLVCCAPMVSRSMRLPRKASFNLCGTRRKREVDCVLSISSPETKERSRDVTPYQVNRAYVYVRRAVFRHFFALAFAGKA